MELHIRARVGLKLAQPVIYDQITLDEASVRDALFSAGFSSAGIDKLRQHIINFRATATVCNFEYMLDQGIPPNILLSYAENFNKFLFIDIHACDGPTYIAVAARQFAKAPAELVRLFNPATGSTEYILNPVLKKTLGSKYRIYLNEILLTERYYPYVQLSEQLEENIFVDVDLDQQFELRIESIGPHKVEFTDIALNHHVLRNINVDKYNFKLG